MKKTYIGTIFAFVSIFLMTIIALGANKYINLDLKYDGASHKYSAEEVKLVVNGKELNNLTMPPIILNSYTLVPAREVFESLGASVDWKSDLQQVYIKYNDATVLLTIDADKAYVNGNAKEMSVPAKIINDKTMIPLRFVSEAIGLNVGWDSTSRTITVNSGNTEVVTEATTKATTTTTKAQNSTNQSTGSLVDITAGNYAQTNINSVTMASNGTYVISASSAISNVSTLELDGGKRIAVDITNAVNATPQSEYTLTSGKVGTIRTGQFSSSPMVARVVFVLSEASSYDINMTSDRKQIVLSFEMVNIAGISLNNSGNSDIITITGSNLAPSVSVNQSSDGKLLTIDANNAILTPAQGTLDAGKFVTSGNYYAQSASTVRISLNVTESVKYTTTQNGKTTTITLSESPFKNMSYDASIHQLTINKNGLSIDINAINQEDNYNSLNYKMTFSGDYSAAISSGDMSVNDGYIKNINFSAVNGRSVITFDESRILAYNVTSDSTYIYIKAVLPKEKYDKIVVLDAGHGGSDPGAAGNGLVEKNLTLDMLNRTLAISKTDGRVKIYATRTTDVYPSFDDRTGLGNEVGDMFISIHINSTTTSSPAGTETYHLYPNTSSSGLTSYTLASKMLDKLLNALGTTNRKVKSSDLKVLRDSTIPATLVEIGFITNPGDASIMGSEAGRQKVAQALYDGMLELFNEYPTGR